MKCPDCGKRLHGVPPLSKEEWVCDDECPANKGESCLNEYYGRTQKEVDTMKVLEVIENNPKEEEVRE